jgi:ornithine cyclodeaminase/alanine dehydrogenase-like protein (mu-crystallin family)
VAGYSTNNDLGLPAISAIVVLNDPATGIPTAILDGGPITAQRTAAVSGVALRHFGPDVRGRATQVALIGAGTQGHSHVPVLGHVLPGVELRLFDTDRARAEALAEVARSTAGVGAASVAADARSAVDGADAVVTAASFTSPERRQPLTNAWLGPGVTVVPIDYDTMCAAEVAREAALFLVDQTDQYLANRDAGYFTGYPDPAAMLGAAILAGTLRPVGRVVVAHLGVGLADVVFGDAIVREAARRGLGSILAR